MNFKIIISFSIILVLNISCSKNSEYEIELTEKVEKQVEKELPKEFVLKSIKLLSLDTLTEYQEANALLIYVNYNLVRLSREQDSLLSNLNLIKSEKEIENSKKKYDIVFDSLNYYAKIGKSVRFPKFENNSTENVKATFLIEKENQKNNVLQNDSIILYINKKVIYNELEFIEKSKRYFMIKSNRK